MSHAPASYIGFNFFADGSTNSSQHLILVDNSSDALRGLGAHRLGPGSCVERQIGISVLCSQTSQYRLSLERQERRYSESGGIAKTLAPSSTYVQSLTWCTTQWLFRCKGEQSCLVGTQGSTFLACTPAFHNSVDVHCNLRGKQSGAITFQNDSNILRFYVISAKFDIWLHYWS